MTANEAGAARMQGQARLLHRLLQLASLLPLRALHALGGGIGRLAWIFPVHERHIARVNVQLAFPGRPLAERREIARKALRENARGLTELAALWYWPVPRVLGLVWEVQGESALRDALAEGRGLLVIAPHHGSWEMLQMWLAQRTTLNALYRPPRQPELEALLNRGRARSGAHLWPARPSGIRALYKALRAGEAVGVLPDQEPPGEGVHVPFFGTRVKTMTLFCKLAARSGAPVVTGWAERLPKGAGYRLHWQRVSEPVWDPDPETAAAAMNRAMEQVVLQRPEQYQWTYRRFSRRAGRTGRNPYREWVSRGGWVERR